jgi:hypothetical protein
MIYITTLPKFNSPSALWPQARGRFARENGARLRGPTVWRKLVARR